MDKRWNKTLIRQVSEFANSIMEEEKAFPGHFWMSYDEKDTVEDDSLEAGAFLHFRCKKEGHNTSCQTECQCEYNMALIFMMKLVTIRKADEEGLIKDLIQACWILSLEILNNYFD